MKLFSPIKIGKIKISNRVFLAPMMDVTDFAYRKICRDAGCGMTYTEMINVDSLTHLTDFVRKKIKIIREEKNPVGIQITTNNPEKIKKIISFLKKFDLVDVNCGCPADLTVDHGSGSYLLKNPEKIAEMIEILKKEKLTVTVKIRLGFNKNDGLKVAKIIEEAGADAITIHGRLANQGNDIPSDWKEVKKIKDKLKIPVIYNGDIDSPKKAKEMFEKTGCDGIMIGRAAIGNPQLFERIIEFEKTGKDPGFDFKKNWKYFREYLHLLKKYEFIKMQRIKYVGGNFIREIQGASQLRAKFMKCRTFEDIEKFAEEME